jgi:hypothetical protein
MRRTALGVALGMVCASAATAAPVARQAHFSLSRQAVAQRARQVPAGARFRMVGVPLEARTVALNLERFEVFTPNARVLVQGPAGQKVVAPPRRAYFRGEVADDPGSFAFLAVGEDNETRGLVMSRERVFVLGAEEGARPDEAMVSRAFDETAPAKQGRSWRCAAGDLAKDVTGGANGLSGLFDGSLNLEEVTAPASAQYSIEVAIETDYELYDRFDSVDLTAAYIGDLMGAMSAIYYRDVGTTLRVNLVSLWTGGAGSDPWAATSSTGALCELGTWWHNNRPQASFPRGTVHMMSGKNTGGGVAWLGVLCGSDFSATGTCAAGQYGGGYGFTGNMTGSFNPNSATVVWDLEATSHEIGHNFNSPHSHCYNNIPTAGLLSVDQCYGAESGCYSGAQSLPSGGKGTIMSYCHLLGGGMSNIALSFGAPGLYGTLSDRISQRMRDHVASRSASCRAVIDAPPADFNGDGRSEVFIYRNGAWLEFPAWPGN